MPRPLHQRLDDDARELRSVALEHVDECRSALLVLRQIDDVVLGDKAAERRVHAGLGIADRHRSAGVAVVAPLKTRNFFRVRTPRLSQNCTAIFMRDLDRDRPGLKKKTRSRSPGRRAASRCARVRAGSWASPPNMTCGICASWLSTAARMWEWL